MANQAKGKGKKSAGAKARIKDLRSGKKDADKVKGGRLGGPPE